MTPEQEAHLLQIKQDFDIMVDGKYRRGQNEHGGDLVEMSVMMLVDNAINESIDQFVYLTTLRNKILRARSEG